MQNEVVKNYVHTIKGEVHLTLNLKRFERSSPMPLGVLSVGPVLSLFSIFSGLQLEQDAFIPLLKEKDVEALNRSESRRSLLRRTDRSSMSAVKTKHIRYGTLGWLQVHV